MKTIWIALIFIAALFLGAFSAQAQDQVSERVPNQNISGLIVGGLYQINLMQGSPKIVIHAPNEVAAQIKTEVQNEILEITSTLTKQKNPVTIDVYGTAFEYLDISGAVKLTSAKVIKASHLHLDISGAAQVTLTTEAETIDANISGASILEIKGTAKLLNGNASGASIFNTSGLVAETSNIEVSGAAGMTYESCDSTKKFPEETTEIVVDKDGEKTTYGVTYDGSVARAKFLGIQVHVDEDDETGEVKIGTHKWVYNSDGEVSHKRVKPLGFNGHWGGVGLGINGFVNNDFRYELPKEYEFMDLYWQRSVNVDLNLYEQNINLSPSHNIGLITGIGFSIYNYFFTKSFTVMTDSNFFSGTYNKGINVKKSKMVTNYIMVPVLFEIQDRNPNPLTKYRWHVNVGAIFGVRVHSHQKTYFNETNKQFSLEHPVTGDVVATATSPYDNISKVHNNFYLQPFKVDASLRVGWGWLNLYTNYSITQMFQKGKGPELHPFTVGIMVTGW